MTEHTDAAGVEYSEVFIGECIVGSCGRPATVRVHEDYVLCALHHLYTKIGEEEDEATEALELVRGWHSYVAHNRGPGYLLELFEYAKGELLEHEGRAERRMAQLRRVEYELDEGDMRTKMGAARKEAEESGAVCTSPECARRATEDASNGCVEHRAVFDAREEHEDWSHVHEILEPWVKAAEPIGSDKLTRVMEKALAEVEGEINRTLDVLESAQAAAGASPTSEPPEPESRQENRSCA